MLNLLDWEATVIIRSRNPQTVGDSLAGNPLVQKALQTGRAQSGTVFIPSDELPNEGEDIVNRCRRSGGEPAAMLMGAAVPIFLNNKCTAVVLAGVLLNGDVKEVDKIRDLIFEGKLYKAKPVGTATIFMKDLRISTNVTDNRGSRAIGTRVSTEVAEQVLKRGLSWTGRARVVDEWYIA